MKNCARRFGLLRAVLGWLLAAAVLLGATGAARADASPQTAQSQQASIIELLHGAQTMSARRFQEQFTLAVQRVSLSGEKPSALETALLRRLKVEKATPDATVRQLVEAWDRYEGLQSAKAQALSAERTADYSNTARAVNEILNLIYARPELEAFLHQQKARLFQLQGKSVSEAEENRKVVELLATVHSDVEQRRIQSMLRLANFLESTGQTTQADNAYKRVLSYPWYLETDADAMEGFKVFYVEAAKGAIRVNAGNLKELQGFYFAPAAMGELGPLLRNAIARAELKQKQQERAAAPPAPK